MYNGNEEHEEQQDRNHNWINDMCEILNIKEERIKELVDEIDKQINNEMCQEMENMRNTNLKSKYSARQQLKYLISINTNNNNNNTKLNNNEE